MLPLLVGYAPFACLIGVAVAGSSAPAAAWAGVVMIFAGTAHLMTIQLVDAGGHVLVVALSALAVNARLAVFSATLAPAWRGTRPWVRLAAAVTVIDPSWMLSSRLQASGAPPTVVRRHYAGASVTLLLGWSGFVALGAVAGNLRRRCDGRAGGRVRGCRAAGRPLPAAGHAARCRGRRAGRDGPSRPEGTAVMRLAIAVLLVGLGSYALRVVPFLLVERVRLSPRAERRLGHAVQAALGALLGGMLLHVADGTTQTVPVVATWAGLAVGAAAALRGWSMGRVAFCGMATFALVTGVGSLL
jgi:branched-subunit amino acid transport protein